MIRDISRISLWVIRVIAPGIRLTRHLHVTRLRVTHPRVIQRVTQGVNQGSIRVIQVIRVIGPMSCSIRVVISLGSGLSSGLSGGPTSVGTDDFLAIPIPIGVSMDTVTTGAVVRVIRVIQTDI